MGGRNKKREGQKEGRGEMEMVIIVGGYGHVCGLWLNSVWI